MSKDFYTSIGYIVVWCMKYIFVPIGVILFAKVVEKKLLQPQKRQKRKRS